MQQYMLDTFRAAQQGTPAPPAPGTHDWQAVREFRTWRDFLAVVDGRAVRRRGRWRRWFRRPAETPVRPAAGAERGRQKAGC